MKELYRRARPADLKGFVGNDETVASLAAYLKKGNLPHTLLFIGPTGCGKTTLARILTKELGADKDFGVKELDATQFRGIDTARAIEKEHRYKPRKGKCRVYIMDEFHQFGQGGASEKNIPQNAMLKIFEQCPDHCYFILCTTNPEMIIPTIHSRAVVFRLRTLRPKETKTLLKRAAKVEKGKVDLKTINKIHKAVEGHPRQAIQLLSKVLQLTNQKQIDAVIENETAAVISEGTLKELCYALLDGKEWTEVREILKGIKGVPAEKIRQGIMGMMASAMLNGWGDYKEVDPGEIMGWFYEKDTFMSEFNGIVFRCYAICEEYEPPYAPPLGDDE